MIPEVTLLMPVGGKHYNFGWLAEALGSVKNQTVLPDEILLIDDIHDDTYGITIGNLSSWFPNIELTGYTMDGVLDYGEFNTTSIMMWRTPWPLGFSAVFNCGIGLAGNELIVYLASDDKLMPTAIEEMVNCWLEHDQKDAFYSCSYDINGETHTIPNNLGMLTRNLWRWYGGYPPAAFVGPDAAMHSVLMKHAPDRRIWVKDGTPLYWVRDHDNTETKVHTWKYVDEMNSIRGKLTDNFVPQEGIVLK